MERSKILYYAVIATTVQKIVSMRQGEIGARRTVVPPVQSSSRVRAGNLSRLKRWFALAFIKATGNLPMQVQIGDGPLVAGKGPLVATVRIRDIATLATLLMYPDLNFGERYLDGSIEIEGNLVRLLEAQARTKLRRGKGALSRFAAAALQATRSNTLAGSRRNIHHHYDLGNDFYRLWLDDQMVYTCAYFSRTDATLEAAQLAKLDHVCRKLRLRPGERVVDAGCGWGALALRAATRYGAKVRAFSLSREQIAYARKRAQALGVEKSVEFIEDDYRNISGQFDAFVSIGMLEHVGRAHYGDLARVIDKGLSRAGRGLIHSIGQSAAAPLNPWIEKRIFPGAYPPTLREMVEIFEPLRGSILDVENLRPHYALTLEHWLQRFESHRDRIVDMYDESFVRAWRLYLSGSIAAFRAGTLQLFQILFNRAGANNAAWTRDHLYRNAD
jgi:cyclopropane-fatty-acyl-phospholipid synthase